MKLNCDLNKLTYVNDVCKSEIDIQSEGRLMR